MCESQITFLVYISRIVAPLDDQAVKEIAEKAALKNQTLNITGLLLRSGGNFVQVLEGPKVRVHKLLETISKDSRHSDLRVIYEEQIETQLFSKWSMNYRPLEGSFKLLLSESIESDNLTDPDSGAHKDPVKTVALLKSLPDFFIKNPIS